MDLISIVVPCYNEQETVPIFYKKLEEVKQKMPLVEFEYWFIDDGSSDDTLKKMKELHSQNVYVHYISFSRNFGKEAGLLAGLKNAVSANLYETETGGGGGLGSSLLWMWIYRIRPNCFLKCTGFL